MWNGARTPQSGNQPIHYNVVSLPQDRIGLAASEKGLFCLVLGLQNEQEFLDLLKKYRVRNPVRDASRFETVTRELEQYYAGKLETFSCPLDLTPGTAFQQQVWRTLQTIPYGETRSYRWLAEAVGRPRAMRAVGNANGKNPLPIVVPCHRVVRENGGLGGYTGGVHIKRSLLDLESGIRGALS